ncbi:hypothetical protein GH714_028607 [Hevea brasiliensis]|uniref:Lactate/malate dehydrogenase C-terminal domain-containing protein n=1 Tax=Hevea brasiliensis TaxID=3981 RepID=A0A6A6LJS7_HEVBR|nr:hypothetical protein GH714_028607 [Hevea brasiliensis]
MCLQEEGTKSWKKLINVAVSGAAGMISNHLLFKLALKAGVFYDKVLNMTIVIKGVPQDLDFLNPRINGLPVKERGGVLIQKWGRSSAASMAVSIVDAIKSLITPTPEGD